MHALVAIGDNIKMMSSLEISELVESRHDNVKTTIERLVSRGLIELPAMQEIKTATKPIKSYLLDKRSSLIVVAQLSPEFTARVVDRWQELEQQGEKQRPSLAQAECELRHSLNIASLLGMTGQDAISYANEATRRLTGIDCLSLAPGKSHILPAANNSGVAVKPCYTATELAAIFGTINSRQVNQLLCKMNFQEEQRRRSPAYKDRTQIIGYRPTSQGLEHAVLKKNGRMRIRHMRWRDSVLPLISSFIAQA